MSASKTKSRKSTKRNAKNASAQSTYSTEVKASENLWRNANQRDFVQSAVRFFLKWEEEEGVQFISRETLNAAVTAYCSVVDPPETNVEGDNYETEYSLTYRFIPSKEDCE